jgi:antitoxin Phd
MKIDTNSIVSITEANQNFSRVARMADETGAVVILRNNAPRYLLMEFSAAEREQEAPGEDAMAIARRVAGKTKEALGASQARQALERQRAGASMRDTEQKIREVNATMAMEGMPLTDDDERRLKDIFEGKTTVEETVQALVEKHSRTTRQAYGRV